jgi:hypothetical protein
MSALGCRKEILMKQYVVDYLNYVQELMAEYNNKVQVLKGDNREDESILFKVRVNICDIFCKMIQAADKKVAAMKIIDEAECERSFQEEYLNWFEKIPATWITNLELARKHDDIIVVQTEEIKLETAKLLRKKFIELSGGEILNGR